LLRVIGLFLAIARLATLPLQIATREPKFKAQLI